MEMCVLCSRSYVLNNIYEIDWKGFLKGVRVCLFFPPLSCLDASVRRDLWMVLEIFRLGGTEINNLDISK